MSEVSLQEPEGDQGAPLPVGRRPAVLALQAVAVLVVLALLGLLVWRVIHAGRGQNLVAAVKRGAAPNAPQFRLAVLWPVTETWPANAETILADGHVSTRELGGRPAVINFWASWCIPCRTEMPRLVASASAHRGRVRFLGVDVQDFKSDARTFLRKYRANYVSVRDGSGTTYAAFGLTGVPETYFVDAEGRITGHYAGEVSRRQLEDGIAGAGGGSR